MVRLRCTIGPVAVNPFVWTRPLDDPAKIVGMDGFSKEVSLILKGQTNVAIFGPRDTGKTTFTTQLARELEQDHGDDAPAHAVIRVNLQRAFSIPAFIACVHDALTSHPEKKIRREARSQMSTLQKEIGFDIKVIKGAVKRTGVTAQQDAEALHAQLASLARLGTHVVVIFDEFQRLNRCPANPLSIIRSALMSGATNHVSLVLTGSIREALKMMLENNEEPIFGEAVQMQLPEIPHADFFEYLDFNFEATGRRADEEALDHLLNLTECHPKRTQQLAWVVWNEAKPNGMIGVVAVNAAYNTLLAGSESSEFETTLEVLANGGDAEANELRALYLLADRGGANLTSRSNVALYGFTSRSLITGALQRLVRRGLVEHRASRWVIVDPLLGEWLRRQSPLALRVGDVGELDPGPE